MLLEIAYPELIALLVGKDWVLSNDIKESVVLAVQRSGEERTLS